MSHDVFISYSSKDKAIADAVCAKLENNKIRCWIAPRDILPGEEYGQALVDAIKRSRVVVLVLSSYSNLSHQVMREIERAVSNEIPIIPLRVENILLSESMEYYLSSVHWLDAITPPIEQHLDKLTDTVVRLLARKVFPDEEVAARQEAEENAQHQEQARQKLVFEEKARREAEEIARREEQARQKIALEEKARREAEENARREEQARQKIALEEKARREAEERLQKEAVIAAQEQFRREAQEREQRAAENRLKEISHLQQAIETALAGQEWGKARQLISKLKNLGPDGRAMADRLKQRLPGTKMPVWVWAIGSLVLVGIIIGVVLLVGGKHAAPSLPVDTPIRLVQAAEKPALQPVSTVTPAPQSPTQTLTLTPTLAPTPTATSLPPVVTRLNANVRSGPGTLYPVLSVIAAKTPLQVLGRNHAGDWLAITLPGDKQGWVAVSALQVGFDVSTLTELEAPPVPTSPPLPTDTSLPTNKRQPTLAPP